MGTPDVEVEIGLKSEQANAQIKKLNKNIAKIKKAALQASKAFAAFNDTVADKKPLTATDNLIKSFGRAGKSTKKLSDDFLGLGSSFKSVSKAFISFTLINKSLDAFTSALQAPIVALNQFETGLIAIGKTTGITDKELEDLGQSFLKLSTRIPVSSKKLLEMGAVAGQLGIQGSKDILRFTETVAKLESATTVVGEEGSRQLAKFLNITGTAPKDVIKVADSLVQLGNDFATTESLILSASTRLASMTQQFDFTAEEVLVLATTMRSLGLASEVSSSAVQRTLVEMDKAVAKGGSALEEFAEIAGQSTTDFAAAFKEDKFKTFNKFVKGLKNVDNISLTLESLKLSGQRTSPVLNTLTKRFGELEEAIESSKNSIGALDKEAAIAFAANEKVLESISNNLNVFATKVGLAFDPIIKKILAATEAATKFLAVGDQNVAAEGALKRLDVKIAETNDKFFQATGTLQQLKAELARDIKDNNFSGRGGLISSIEKTERKVASITTLLDKLAKRRVTIQASVDQGGDDSEDPNNQPPGGDGSKALQASFDIRKAFQEAQRINDKAHLDATLTAVQVADTALFETLNTGLGEQETLRVLARVNEIKANADKFKTKEEREKEHLKALNVLRTAELKAQDNIAKEEEKQERKKLKDRQSFFNSAAILSRSGNKELIAISKAAAIAQIAVNTPTSISSSFDYGASIGGPPLGFVFGAIAAAAQATQASNILSAGNFQNGGIIGGNSMTGDNLTANVNSGEMILNRQQQTQLFNQTNGSGQVGAGTVNQTNITVELDGEVVGRAVSRQVADGLVLGEVV